ncbi:MAG: cytochrome b [Rhodomicrobium sp.]|nr:cytochrome b [Rhodomicrobium sp.]
MTTMSENARLAGVESYSGFAKLLHWIVALCVLIMIPAGLAMNRVDPGTLQNGLYTLHRSLGMLVLVLMIVRLAYRLLHGVPAPEPTLTAWQRVSSHLVHLSLYVLIIVQGIIGWVATSAFGAAISFFGLFTVPALVAKDQELSKPLFFAHDVLGFIIAGLVLLHIAAALYHFLIRGDRVLQRMA